MTRTVLTGLWPAAVQATSARPVPGTPLAAILLLASFGAGCSNNSLPTTPSANTSATTSAAALEVFSGTLAPRGTRSYAFQVTGAANATFTLASVTNPSTGRPVDTTLRLGIGVPAGEGCSVANAVDAAPGLSAQLAAAVVVGTYCLQVTDSGNLNGTVNFAVRIQRP